MKIAIIGSGNMGSAMAASFASAGHSVLVAARDASKAQTTAAKAGNGTTAADIKSAAQNSQIVVLAIPYSAVHDVLGQCDLAGKVVVDVTNPITADYKGLVVGHTTSAAEEIQRLAPRARVVKAFNTIFAALFASESRKGARVQVFVAGDDEEAKAAVSELVNSLGFEAVESGPLSNSRFIEPIGEMNIHFGFFLGKGTTVAPAWVQI